MFSNMKGIVYMKGLHEVKTPDGLEWIAAMFQAFSMFRKLQTACLFQREIRAPAVRHGPSPGRPADLLGSQNAPGVTTWRSTESTGGGSLLRYPCINFIFVIPVL